MSDGEKKGFARMTPEEHKEVSRRGGKATSAVYGFHLLPREEHREIAKAGGRASAASGKGHRFNSETGRAAGRKGHRFNSETGRAAGRTGGMRRQRSQEQESCLEVSS